MNKKFNKTYERVMPRVQNHSRNSLRSNSVVTRHGTASSVRIGAKASSSNFSSGVYSELPIVLDDYEPEPVVQSKVVRPRRTLRSMDTSKSPPRSVLKASEKGREFRAPVSTPAVVGRISDGWSDSHVRECYSSRSHSKLKELKEEIRAFREKDKMMKLRSRLYKKCGVVLDDLGQVAEDKAVQAEVEEKRNDEKDR